jgi:uncharacterized RDD family membrane protein YckC
VSVAVRRPGDPDGSAALPSHHAVPARAVAVEEAAELSYVGLVTRTIAFALDAAMINVVALIVAGAVTLGLSILSIPDSARTVIEVVGGALYVVWTIGYFVVFWSTTGQTPGSRAMRIRVCDAHGRTIPPRRALLRVAGLWLAAIPLLLGFLPILIDNRRRGLQDFVARTVVVDAPERR